MTATRAPEGVTAAHLLSLRDLSDAQLRRIVERGRDLRLGGRSPAATLEGSVVGTLFTKTSTRTRVAFSAGALRLGARVVALGPQDLQLNTGETLEDTGRVLDGMLDVLVARTAGPEAQLTALASGGRMAVINAMSAEEHPTQALADLTTLLVTLGRVDGLRLLYLGEGNNTAVALALALTRFEGVHLELRTPEGFGLPPQVRQDAEQLAAQHAGSVQERHDLADLPEDVDVVYTTRWQTTGTTKPFPQWRERFEPFRVGPQLLSYHPRALFMHDLPAHRGEEVVAEVIDGPRSIVFEQAEMKMYSAMAVLERCRS